MNGLTKKIIVISMVIAMQLANATAVFAQSSPDTRSPLIELEAVAQAVADTSQVFTAQVVDDRVLKDVSLYFRRAGQQPFLPVPMTQIGDSSYYSVTVDTKTDDLRAFEYYIQARDEGGNRTVEGYAFDPYTRVITANPNLVVAPPTAPIATTNETSSSGGLRWWQIAAGVLLVGALASAAGGDSGASNEATVPLTVNLTGL